jgi:hypothetical protein
MLQDVPPGLCLPVSFFFFFFFYNNIFITSCCKEECKKNLIIRVSVCRLSFTDTRPNHGKPQLDETVKETIRPLPTLGLDESFCQLDPADLISTGLGQGQEFPNVHRK